MYIQLDFIVRRLAEKAAADPSLADQQPYRAAYERRPEWFGGAITKHYQGDDADLKVLAGAVMSLHESMTVEEHAGAGQRVLRRGHASDTGPAVPRSAATRRWSNCCGIWRPTASPATSSPAAAATSCARSPRRSTASRPSGSSGSAQGLEFEGGDGHGDLLIQPALDVFDDGPGEAGADLEPDRSAADPGRGQLQRRRRDARCTRAARPTGAAAAGAARRRRTRIRLHRRRGDGRSSMRRQYGWTVVSMKNDWATVFSD